MKSKEFRILEMRLDKIRIIKIMPYGLITKLLWRYLRFVSSVTEKKLGSDLKGYSAEVIVLDEATELTSKQIKELEKLGSVSKL